MVFNVNHSTPILFGEGSSQQVGEKLKAFGSSKVFVVCDKGVKSTGIVAAIEKNIEEAGLEVIEFDGVIPDPPMSMVDEAAAIARENSIDSIVGIGGGSTMDTAKAVNILMNNPGSISDYAGLKTLNPQNKGVKMVLIPTTSGTSSEVSRAYVVTDPETDSKTGGFSINTIADLAIVDPVLTKGVPAHITASTGMDAFAHAVESVTNKSENLMSDVLAEKGIALITENLKTAYEDGSNMAARTNMSFACSLIGYAFADKGTHIGHALADGISSIYHLPHGIGCSLSLPVAVRYAALDRPEKVRTVGKAMGLSLSSDMTGEALGLAVSEAIRQLYKSVGIKNMSGNGVTSDKVTQLAEYVAGNIRFVRDAVKPDANVLAEIIASELEA